MGRRLSRPHVASPAELLASAIIERIDCLVLDISMPGMSGFELRDALRAAGRRIPIVFMSGEPQGAALAGDAVAFLTKPVEQQSLFDALARALTDRS